jgi:hypothetical protein
MSSCFLKALFLAGLLLPFSTLAQDNEVKAAATISIEQDQDIWAGQQVTLNLDLKTTGYSFSNSHFNLPEVSGAFLMQTDTTTIKRSESIDGQDWQVIRYPLALYPQKAGQLEIPPVNVRFSTSAGFGSTMKAFEFQTRPLELMVKLPPGVNEGDLVVTTTSFELDHSWQPVSGAARTGDAITLTVLRRANDISAMLLPPLPVFRTNGLAAYPQAPEVRDKTNRGELTGERTDIIIWVVEKPGAYEIPGIRFQWWDPASHELKQQIVPGLSLDILPSAADRSRAGTAEPSEQESSRLLQILVFSLAGLLVFGLYLHFGRKARTEPLNSEKSAFTRLQKDCKSNQAAQAHSAIHAWLTCSPFTSETNSRPVTLSKFARNCNDKALSAELKRLQEALISSNKNWQGDDLLSSLQRVRHKLNRQKIVQSKAYLAPLNP